MMTLFRARRSAAIAAIGLLAGGAGVTRALAAGGGLSVSPGILEHVASPGGAGSLKISNTTGAPMTIRLALRPWLQALSGEVSPNRARTLGEVRASAGSFTLAAGASRTVAISLARRPAGGSIYGAIEVTGAPGGRAHAGITLDYRIVNSLRLVPARRVESFRASAGGLVEQGTVKDGTLLLAVRNTGNTIVPIGGTVLVSGQGHSLHASAVARAIVPGQTVNVPLTQLTGSLPRGRYAVSVTLTQAGHRLGAVNRTIDLR